MRRILHADQRLKQNHKEENLPAFLQEQFSLGKNLDRCWTGRIFTLRFWSIEEIDASRRWLSDWILENYWQSSETFLVLPALVWRQVEEKHGRRRRKQEKIPVLYWFIMNNLVPPSSSRSFRTQFHWSYFTGQCHYSGRFLQVHLSCRMCDQFTFHHQFGIGTWRSTFEQQTNSILSACGWPGGWGPHGTREGPEPACVQTPFRQICGTRRGGRMN